MAHTRAETIYLNRLKQSHADLLAACMAMLEVYQGSDKDPSDHAASLMRAALAKALEP